MRKNVLARRWCWQCRKMVAVGSPLKFIKGGNVLAKDYIAKLQQVARDLSADATFEADDELIEEQTKLLLDGFLRKLLAAGPIEEAHD